MMVWAFHIWCQVLTRYVAKDVSGTTHVQWGTTHVQWRSWLDRTWDLASAARIAAAAFSSIRLAARSSGVSSRTFGSSGTELSSVCVRTRIQR